MTNPLAALTSGWLEPAVKLGAPAVISIFLVVWLAFRTSTDMQAMSAALTATQGAMTEHVFDTRQHQMVLEEVGRQTCRNTARTDVQLIACEFGSRR